MTCCYIMWEIDPQRDQFPDENVQVYNISPGWPLYSSLKLPSAPLYSLLLTVHALVWCNRSSGKLVTISQKFFSRKYCGNNNIALPWELKDNCVSLWHCCFISFTLHFWFPPESCFFFFYFFFPPFAHIYFWHLIWIFFFFCDTSWITCARPCPCTMELVTSGTNKNNVRV